MNAKRAVSVLVPVAGMIIGTVLARTPRGIPQSGQVLQGRAQQSAGQAPGDVFAANGSSYQDQFSSNCSKGNTSPFAGMNPLVCHGIMAPADSKGRCSLAGLRLLRQEGSTCYYCKLLNPPINGIIIPIDQVQQARQQGFKCGADQANPNCLAVCWRESGSGPYIPPPDTQLVPGGPGTAGNGPGNQPPLRGRVSTSGDPCRPFGPGGYDYCANPTQPPGCVCPNNIPPTASKPYQPPKFDPLQYARGLLEGLQDCAGTFRDMAAAVGFMLQGDFVSAASSLGLQPGQSVILRTIYQEATTQNLGISPEEAGRIAGRRLCLYGIVPAAAKALRGPPGNRFNPLEGSVVSENAPNLVGKWVSTKWGPVQLGSKLGDGKFGSVYKLPKGRAIKVSTNRPDAGKAFQGQIDGSQLLKNAGIPTPTIHDFQIGVQGDPSFLLTDDVTATGPGAWNGQILPARGYPTLPQVEAIRDLYTKIRDAGLTWGDGHPHNVFWFGDGTAGVLDADMVFSSDLFRQQPLFTQATLRSLLGYELDNMIANPKLFMNALWDARYVTAYGDVAGRLP